MASYDREKTMEAAHWVYVLSDQVNGEVVSAMREFEKSMDRLQGKTARSMERRLQEVKAEAERQYIELRDIAEALSFFADSIDQADKRLARGMYGEIDGRR